MFRSGGEVKSHAFEIDMAFTTSSNLVEICRNVLGPSCVPLFARLRFQGKCIGKNQLLSAHGVRSGDKVFLERSN